MGTEESSDSDLEGASLQDRVAVEKARALREPGPSWRQWMFQSALRAYYVLGILVADVQVVVFWYEEGSAVGLVVSLALALYLEFLLYRYLWYRPPPEALTSGKFHPTWIRPAEYGRWTVEADLVRAGISIRRTEEGPNLKEFL